jgi:DNA-binding CsgD family transcriptional regulator
MLGYGIEADRIDMMTTFLEPAWKGLGSKLDPDLDAFCRRVVRERIEVWDMAGADHVLGGGGRAWKTVFYNEVLRYIPAGDTHSLLVSRPEGVVHLTTHSFHRNVEAGQNLPLLRVLLPAFKAGLDTIDRLAGHRATLDAVSEPLAAFDVDGREVHRNAALSRVLDLDPEAAHIRLKLDELAARVRLLGFPLRTESSRTAPVTAEVRTARGRYMLRAVLLGPGTFGSDGAFLVTVEAVDEAPILPAAAEVRARHGLTRREAEIALLVAQGLSNEQISDRLFVSRHTGRHHVEALMDKLGLQGRGRASVALHLLRAEPTPS